MTAADPQQGETPRTNSIISDWSHWQEYRDLALQLERELAEAKHDAGEWQSIARAAQEAQRPSLAAPQGTGKHPVYGEMWWDFGEKLSVGIECENPPTDKHYLCYVPYKGKDASEAIKVCETIIAALSATAPKDEYICKCGIRVTPHRCSTGVDF